MFDFVVAALATYHAVTVWRTGTIFAGQRARLEESESRFAELMLCRFCLSVWVGFFFALAVLLPYPDYTLVPRIFMYGLALAAVAGAFNAIAELATYLKDDDGPDKTGFADDPHGGSDSGDVRSADHRDPDGDAAGPLPEAPRDTLPFSRD